MKRFTPLFVLGFIIFPFLVSCEQDPQKEINGNYEIIHEKIAILNYDEILLGVPAEVIYEQLSQDEPFLQVTVDKNIFPSLDISVKNNRLIIVQNNDSLLKPSQFKIFTNSKNIKRINIEQAGYINMKKEINAQNMEIIISGAGDLKADSLYCENLQIEILEAGNLTIEGAATNGNFVVNGSGDINALNFLVQRMDCRVEGSGDVQIHVLDSLTATAKGTGEIRYKGKPDIISLDKYGTGDIIRIDD